MNTYQRRHGGKFVFKCLIVLMAVIVVHVSIARLFTSELAGVAPHPQAAIPIPAAPTYHSPLVPI